MTDRVLIVGAGGHGKVVAEALLASGIDIWGFVDRDASKWGTDIQGHAVLGGDDFVLRHKPGAVRLANGIGSTATTAQRREVFVRLKQKGYSFATVVHPGAIVSPSAILAEGVQVMAGSVLQAGARIGANSIINTGALIDHDCDIGEHCHVAPGAVLSGNVIVGDSTHIGCGVSIIQSVRIGRDVLVAAGSTVIDAVADRRCVMGVPARERENDRLA